MCEHSKSVQGERKKEREREREREGHGYDYLVVLRVKRSAGELAALAHNFVNGLQKVLFCSHLAMRTDGKHARFCRNTTKLGTCCVGTQTSNEIVADISLH